MYCTLGTRFTWLLVENTTFGYKPAALLFPLRTQLHFLRSAITLYVGGSNPFVAYTYCMSFINCSAGKLTLDKFVIDN